MYSQFFVSLYVDAYRLYGGHGVLNFCDDISLSGIATSSVLTMHSYTDDLLLHYSIAQTFHCGFIRTIKMASEAAASR